MKTKNIAVAFVVALILFVTNVFSQAPIKYTGYFCTGVNELSPFKYTREYKRDNDNFITLYKIYSPTEGYYLNITATHNKSEKKIIVDIDDITTKIGGHISTKQFSYQEPTLKMLSIKGAFKSMFDAQNALPYDLAVKFASNKFENIKVMNIVKDDQLNSTKWYILDE